MRSKSKSKSGNEPAVYAVAGASLLVTALEILRRAVRQAYAFDPSRDPVKSWIPEDYGIPAGAAEEVTIETPDGQLLHGWYCRTEHPIASALYCHGNKGNITVFAEVAAHLLRSGINTLLFDYRGYGRSTGFATPGGLLVDAVAAARFHDRIRPRGLPSLAYGFSLGGPIAAHAASKVHFDALVLQSTFTSFRDMAKLFKPPLPLHLVSGNPFDTLRAVGELKIPLLVIHGAEDGVCPPAMGETLFRACPGAREIHIVEGALHTNVHEVASERLRETITRLIQELPPRAEAVLPDADTDATWTDRTLRAMRTKMRRGSHV